MPASLWIASRRHHFAANGVSGDGLVSVLQDRSQDYVHLDSSHVGRTKEEHWWFNVGLDQGVDSPTVEPLLKFAATGNLSAAKSLWKEDVYKSEDVVTALRLVARNYPHQYTMWLDAVKSWYLSIRWFSLL